MPLMSWEETLTCPYNPSHQITRKRMQVHLVKCRKNHPDVDFVTCKYNSCHHIAKPELKDHEDNCPDRKIVELAMYNKANGDVKYVPPPAVNQGPICTDGDDEDWELEAAGHVSYDPKKKCEKSNVLRKIQGATPSERKKFYAAERIRLENLQTVSEPDQEKEKKKKEEEEKEEEEKRPRVIRASQEPLKRPTVLRRPQEGGSLTKSRQGSITSRLLSLIPDTTESRRRPASIINPGKVGAISEADDTDLSSNGTLNSRLGRLALSGRGRGEAMKRSMN